MSVPAGAGGARALIEKSAGLLPLPFVARVVVPGVLATAILYPLTGWRNPVTPDVNVADVWMLVVLLASTLLLGTLVSIVLAGEIYKLYEGRTFWPRPTLTWFTRRQAMRVSRLRARADEEEQRHGKTLHYDEIWSRLRAYPVDGQGEPYAPRPTLLGNILAEYEHYPDTRYGMDAVFYWPRLWLDMPREQKKEIDASWSIADGLLSLSAISFAGGLLWLAVAAGRTLAERATWLGPLRGLPPHLPFGTPGRAALAAVGLLVLGYVWYRISLPFHRQNGDTFKAIFDLHRDRLAAITRLGPSESAIWDGVWSYLQYLYVRCMRCGHYFPAIRKDCDACGYARSPSLSMLRRSGPPSG